MAWLPLLPEGVQSLGGSLQGEEVWSWRETLIDICIQNQPVLVPPPRLLSTRPQVPPQVLAGDRHIESNPRR